MNTINDFLLAHDKTITGKDNKKKNKKNEHNNDKNKSNLKIIYFEDTDDD
jgi:hypothetical protein